MDLNYDRKFEEMKKYIPFLESMIKRLETTNTGAKNPRKAQLDKIRSLRDLLLDKKKRMKMENLLKCEQVLVNLYAKVEQRDLLADTTGTEQIQKAKSDFNIVRNKLKSVASKLQDDAPETLPEIARAINTEVVCTPGSKEPALFQRRPNKESPPRQSPNSENDTSNSSRHYTRVLMSPEHKQKEWLANSSPNMEKPLFSRRSPRKSPRRYSPSYKKERKKPSKQRSKSSHQSKDLNITLKVPEETLGSLNTKDILSRIINCNHSDVDIDTLRGLRSQILGELKQTGTNDDISDLILKSYKTKQRSVKKNDEVEEGELSDSESETIENIYGNLVVVNQSEGKSNINNTANDKKNARKIQICLVINSDKEKEMNVKDQILNTTPDITDFEAYTETKSVNTSASETPGDIIPKEVINKEINETEKNMPSDEKVIPIKEVEEHKNKSVTKNADTNEIMQDSFQEKPELSSTETFKPNFYQPTEDKEESGKSSINEISCKSPNEQIDIEVQESKAGNGKKNKGTSIKKEVVSEIDILQALKKEILGETTTVPISEAITPPLHQPKITKVASAQEIVPKKRISIETYKEKSVPSMKQPLFNSVKQQSLPKDDNTKKQSLKLTEKECERFNFPVNVSPVDSSEDEDTEKKWDFDFLYGSPESLDLKNKDESSKSGPKSPDHEDFADTGIKPPVIIPSDPVKNIVPIAKADIDMRTLMPSVSSITIDGSRKNTTLPSEINEKVLETTRNEKGNETIRKSIPETREKRTRKEPSQHIANNSPNSYLLDSDKLPRPSTTYPNVPPSISPNIPPLMSLNITTPTQNPNVVSNLNSIVTPILNSNISLMLNSHVAPNMTPTIISPGLVPNMNPSMTPNRMIPSLNPMMTPILTPNARSYEMTPRPNFDIDDYSNHKHVYAPLLPTPTFEPRDFSEKDQVNHWEVNVSPKWDDRNTSSSSMKRDVDYHRNRNERFVVNKRLDSPQIAMECPVTPNPSFGRMECPPTPNPSFGRMECPPTPNPSFGRMECPPTPNSSFGRMECPSTPNPSFGRMECPLTPNPSFGRMEAPMTPVHSFGRADCPMTSNHSFGRSETNMTQVNVFGRGEHHHKTASYNHKYINFQDPRLNRSSDYDKCQSRHDGRNRTYLEDDYNVSDRYRRSQVKSYEQDSRNSRDRRSRRESSAGRSLPIDCENDEARNKVHYHKDYQHRREKYRSTEDAFSAHREREVTRTYTRESSIEKPISVQSHTGRSFNIDTSFNRTFQETDSSSFNKTFDARRQRASSVGRSLQDTSTSNRKSTNKTEFELDIPDRKATQFRRACSVGRELKGYSDDKNFKDIKEDLRSCKFHNYNSNLLDRDHKLRSRMSYNNEKVSLNENHNTRDTQNKNPTFTKSTGYQIDRDPRKRMRDNDCKSTMLHNTLKYSPKKNFRDPRLRREMDIKNKDKDKNRNSSSSRYNNYGIVYSNDNIAKGTILASAVGVKNFKIPKIKRNYEEKEVETINDGKVDSKKGIEPLKHARKEDMIIVQGKKVDSQQKKPETNTVINEDTPSIKEITEKVKYQEDLTDICERRITRSAIRDKSRQISKKSPVKKLRRIKTPIIYDSDSDSQEKESNNKESNENVENKDNVQITDVTAVSDKNVDKVKKNEMRSNTKQGDEIPCTESLNSSDENYSTIHSVNKKDILHDNVTEKNVPSIVINESCQEQNDSLDINFEVDDELLSDNIASGSVIDNINALIADLDHHIESPKINDFNDKFINNIVGSISSTLDSQFQINLTSDVTLVDKLDQDTVKVDKSENDLEYVNVLIQPEGNLSIQNNNEEIKNNEAKGTAMLILEDKENKHLITENSDQEILVKSTSDIQAIKHLNSDAIVSTTAYDEVNEVPQDSQLTRNDTVPVVGPLIPDSTIGSNESNANIDKDSQESVPDSTNELTSEMNITSTLNCIDMSSREQSVANASCSDNIPRIDSIGKLLSILEDKNKIKELLALLGKDSGENEKIKKKLEKLSEIVSDDEENSVEIFKNTSKEEKEKKVEDDQAKHKGVVAEQSQKNENECIFNNADDKKLNEEKSIVQGAMLNDKEEQSNSEKVVINEVSKIDDNVQEHVDNNLEKNKLLSVINDKSDMNAESQKMNEDVVNTPISSNADKEVKENDSVTNIIEVKDAIQNNFNQVSKVKDIEITDTLPVKKVIKKSKITKKGKSRSAKNLSINKDKRITRSEASISQTQNSHVPKKPSRELLKLQEDIRDMFISEDILNATGIRMCRLAKLVDDKHSKGDARPPNAEVDPKPIVVLENIKSKILSEESIDSIEKKIKKKESKSKSNAHNETSVEPESKGKSKYKPGPKSKTKKQDDQYIFETESNGESCKTVDSNQYSDTDSDSASTKSFGSSEVLVELKKKTKRKRRSWQLGVIRKKGVKMKSTSKNEECSMQTTEDDETHETKDSNLQKIPDFNCFTDKSYCFHKNTKNYLCRLCGYHGNDIVPHYKKQHPHSEIPLSRLSPEVAKKAIEQCETMNLQAISKIQTMKYVCRFCFQEFIKKTTALETFFWHVVSVHTGEYKHLCSECINVTRCPFHLDIPPPPKNLKRQLIGYICGRCNFTQVSLENLKTHVIIRHDDEQTEVYSINLSEIPKKHLQSLIAKVSETSVERQRMLRSTRSNQSISEPSDDHSDITDSIERVSSPKNSSKNKIGTKLGFENDDMSDTDCKNDKIMKDSIKFEIHDDNQDSHHNDFSQETNQDSQHNDPTQETNQDSHHNDPTQETNKDSHHNDPTQETNQDSHHNDPTQETNQVSYNNEIAVETESALQKPCKNVFRNGESEAEIIPSTDVLDYPHFKIKLTDTGSKQYICCINGVDYHYKTTLLISFKKHVQLKHTSENWDGYCFVCKVIVTGQGKHTFRDCLEHFLDKHMDNFPILEEILENKDVPEPQANTSIEDVIPKTYINVRPLSQLISSEKTETRKNEIYNYEEAQTEVMNNKYRIVLDTMLSPEKLIQVFKCAGRFCSFTTDNAEQALLHASTHQKIGGEGSLKCSYCSFDSSGNAIDLVMHVFNNYRYCSYACSKCFYRAASSQMVYAHVKRIHTEFEADNVPVLSCATVVKDSTEDYCMSRDEAVSYYNCNNRDSGGKGICKFKTYVETKFRDHLQTTHAQDQEFSCFVCNNSMPSANLLTKHMKSHGFKIYQCCRCIFGADKEAEMIAHASEKHPLQNPRAYLRVITAKDGVREVRVLPLVALNKFTVKTNIEITVVTPDPDKESPVKQAERSIDLEKLIGQTNAMIKSENKTTNAATIKQVEVTSNEKQIQSESEASSLSEPETTSTVVLTQPGDPEGDCNMSNVVVKIEPEKREFKTSVIVTSATVEPDVVCLDSDEETSRSNIIDLSGDDTPELKNTDIMMNDDTKVKIPRPHLYKCSKCFIVSKSPRLFKKHLTSCFPNELEPIKCAYCLYSAVANVIVNHYNREHLERTQTYICGKCDNKCINLIVAKKHMRLVHNVNSTEVNVKSTSSGGMIYVIDVVSPEAPALKRKLSDETGNNTSSEPPLKLKKYGPLDVDKLPINPILDDLVYCSLCEFSTKVRLNMVRHLQLHAEQQPVPQTAPVNPVPHLESNEKHFDKMVNLASSSIATSNKTAKDGTVIVSEYLSLEAAMIYPQYVPDKHRYTCGAKGCSYISVNESMFKIHWETLHTGINDYHCVHCPPHQHLDTTQPLTVARIIAHLKMHDLKLYACSTCIYYHPNRKFIEKHLKEVHSGKLIIVREDGAALPSIPAINVSTTAPTMDLKLWQCGLCKFKSMIRPEVIDHCGRFHQSKMQFKCMYCGFRTSNIENISKHQSKQHPGKKEDVFYFYYQEGSIPDEADGIARWQKQSQKSESEIKIEIDTPPSNLLSVLPKSSPVKPSTVVNLDIVKKEVIDLDIDLQVNESIEDLCNSFGQFCDPNGLKYKCPLCKVIIEDTKEAMQSHLYEELQYRKWRCAVCSYKAFHKPGLQQHVQTEHGHNREVKEPIELQEDCRIELWVAKLLEHQTTVIERNKENLAKQKAEILRSTPGSSVKVTEKPVEPSTTTVGKPNMSMADLEKLFGPFGAPNNMYYTCPKCNINARAEAIMQEHLESELNKIRWCCNMCSETFQTYHEAQFHCRSVHAGLSSRPVEAVRDVSLRAAWVTAVLRVQKLSMNFMPVTEPPVETPAQPTDISPDNSLLVVRYEEKVPTPEEQMRLNKKSDTDEKKTATDEVEKRKSTEFECQYCYATYKNESFFHGHVLKHFGLKPFTCPYCPHTDHKRTMEWHVKSEHPRSVLIYMPTPLPSKTLIHDHLKGHSPARKPGSSNEVEPMLICLVCELAMTRAQSQTHHHNNTRPQFGMKGTVVYRCSFCFTLHKTGNDFNLHHKQYHASFKKNSSFYKLQYEHRSLLCSFCNENFANMAEYRTHHQTKHGLKSCAAFETAVKHAVDDLDEAVTQGKRKAEDSHILPVPKRVARKSTTKLPNVMAVARKSTTKLPFDVPSDDEEYSYYGTKPSMDNLENVTTLMPFYNTFVPFTLKKLSQIIKIFPQVVVKDINNKQ